MQQLTIEEVKLFLQDQPEKNRLLHKEEFTPELITMAIEFTINRYNEMQPLVEYFDIETFPYKMTLLYGVCAFLYKSAAMKKIRNRIVYSSGGTSIDDEAMADMYLKLSEMYNQEFMMEAKQNKIAENIKIGFSSVPLVWGGRL